jgi:hypothetical protein
MTRTRISACALAATALAVAGCGGSKSSGSTSSASQTTSIQAASTSPTQTATQSRPSGPPLSRAELVAKADAICAGVNAKRASITLRSSQDYTTKLPPLAAYEQAAVARMGTLTPPASMASNWKQMLADSGTIATNTAKVAGYAEAGNHAVTRQLILSSNAAQQRIATIAARYGFKVCGRLGE